MLIFHCKLLLQQNAFYNTERYTGMQLPYDEQIVVVDDAPQQDTGSVDCGAVVL